MLWAQRPLSIRVPATEEQSILFKTISGDTAIVNATKISSSSEHHPYPRGSI